jgi:hypothetical protein
MTSFFSCSHKQSDRPIKIASQTAGSRLGTLKTNFTKQIADLPESADSIHPTT